VALTPEQDALIANDLEQAQRLAKLFESLTAGPAQEFPQAASLPAPSPPPTALWVDGWYAKARKIATHPGRIGGAIRPWSIVQHSTDMLEGEWDALLASCVRTAGAGNAFTFGIGRTPDQGLVQLCSVFSNANHAGGPTHGVYVVDGKSLHPNLCAVGIEMHNAGGVRLIGGQWWLVEDGKAHGPAIPADQVVPDPARPGRGWQKPTDYQLDTARALWLDLEEVLGPVPKGATTRAFGEAVQKWGDTENARIVTHHMLDPQARSDPWPMISGAAKTFAAGRGY
jgi:hypothetical protein